jgi:hypothetical protein
MNADTQYDALMIGAAPAGTPAEAPLPGAK